MRTIALEEHIGTPKIAAAARATGKVLSRKTPDRVSEKLRDVDAGRLADMDAAGIDLQVLSATGVGLDKLDRETGTTLAREHNDALAGIVRTRPDRFAAFALLAMQDPERAAAELERCVVKLGFKGALISGTIDDRFLDDPVFEPVLAQAERLDVPLYLHPAPPPAAVYKAYFSGLPDDIAGSLATSAWGWHVETGLHSLRLVVAGVFDRFPKLQVIIGHMGENLPFSLVRADERLDPFTTHHQRLLHSAAAALRADGLRRRPHPLFGGLPLRRECAGQKTAGDGPAESRRPGKDRPPQCGAAPEAVTGKLAGTPGERRPPRAPRQTAAAPHRGYRVHR
jgi:uncharacterized protein